MNLIKIKRLADNLFSQKIVNPEVAHEVELERHRAEKWASWVQTLFIGFIFSIWLLTSKGYASGAVQFEAVPYFVICYLPLLLLRLFWASKKLISEHVSMLFLFIDISFVMGLIWVFHIQYDQNPGFYFRLPLFGYLFVLVSLRALTMRVGNVIFATLGSVGAWVLLITFAIRHPNSTVTHNFLEYTLTHSILIGAEVEKIIYLIAVGTVLGFSVRRQEKLLQRTIEATLKSDSLNRFFSPEVSRLIVASGGSLKPGHGEKRQSAILMVNLRGFSNFAHTMEPDVVMALLTEYQSRIVPIIFKNNGCIDKFMGDGILAHFGAAAPSSTFAADCLKTMVEIHDEVDSWNKVRFAQEARLIDMNSAACVGQTVFGTAGGAGRLEYTVIGSPVNLAAKLEKFNKDAGSESITTKRTLYLAKEQGYEALVAGELSQASISGIDTKMDLILLRMKKSEKKSIAV